MLDTHKVCMPFFESAKSLPKEIYLMGKSFTFTHPVFTNVCPIIKYEHRTITTLSYFPVFQILNRESVHLRLRRNKRFLRDFQLAGYAPGNGGFLSIADMSSRVCRSEECFTSASLCHLHSLGQFKQVRCIIGSKYCYPIMCSLPCVRFG